MPMRPAINAMVSRIHRWLWLMASSDAVFQNIRCFPARDNAKHLLGEADHGVVVTDQCASYNWLDPATSLSFAWLMFNANLQEMAEYSGGGQTAYAGRRLDVVIQERVPHPA